MFKIPTGLQLPALINITYAMAGVEFSQQDVVLFCRFINCHVSLGHSISKY